MFSEQGRKQWDCPQSQQGNAGKGVHGQSHGQILNQQLQSTCGPAQHSRSMTTGMAFASVIPRASAYKAAEPAAPEASTQKDDDHVYIRARDKMAPLDDGTETVQH